MDNWLDMTAST